MYSAWFTVLLIFVFGLRCPGDSCGDFVTGIQLVCMCSGVCTSFCLCVILASAGKASTYSMEYTCVQVRQGAIMEDTMATIGDKIVCVCSGVYDGIGWIRSHFYFSAEHW